MNEIIDFLESQSYKEYLSNYKIDREILSKSFTDLTNRVDTNEANSERITKQKSKPKINDGQIWLCKQEYYDALGNHIIGNIPFLVVIVSKMENIADETFVRIQPISPFTEFYAEDEIIIRNNSIVGFEFIIETWNEQPILIELLDEFVGYLDINFSEIDEPEVNLSNNQIEFRRAEINNSGYLRQSISSFIEYQELKEENAVLVNIENSFIFAIKDNGQSKISTLINEPPQAYLQAAKKGTFKERPAFFFQKTINNVDVEIKIIKEEETYTMVVKRPNEIELRDLQDNLFKQSTSNLYDGLKSGLYFLRVKSIDKEIRIKLR